MISLKHIATVLQACTVCWLLSSCNAVTPVVQKEQPSWTTYAVEFSSRDGTVLSGSLISPSANPPRAIVVLVHGSGPAERYTALGAIMALRGIATLTYDKRGVGKSGGQYEGANNISQKNLQLLASDAASAMRWVSIAPQWQSLPRGFVGLSQAGWVIPLALADAPAVDFAGFWSGPTCTTSEQLQFQHFMEQHPEDAAPPGQNDISDAMKHVIYRQDDVDPLIPLRNTSTPMIWLFGGRDRYVPIGLATMRLQHLIDQNHSNFTYEVFPNEGHNLADSPQQESFKAMIEWIRKMAERAHP